MDILKSRSQHTRQQLLEIKSNRGRLDKLKNIYQGMNAVIVATGPGFTNYIDFIKDNMDDNTIIICVKQAMRFFDTADFHILNMINDEKYDYNPKPTVIRINCGRHIKGDADINLFLSNLNGVQTPHVNSWNYIPLGEDTLSLNDKNIGPGENMVINGGHIMLELGLPLAIQLGVKNLAIVGYVGGNLNKHDIPLATDTFHYPKYVYDELEKNYEISSGMHDFFKEKFDMNIYILGESCYRIPKITKEEYIDIFKKK